MKALSIGITRSYYSIIWYMAAYVDAGGVVGGVIRDLEGHYNTNIDDVKWAVEKQEHDMSTTQDKMDVLNDAIEEFEMARDACADAISDIVIDLSGMDIARRLAAAEPDGNVPETLRHLHSEIEEAELVSDEQEK